MFKFFDENAVYVLPNGVQKTGIELKNSGQYPLLSVDNCLVDICDGILSGVCLYESTAESYGVDVGSSDKDSNLIMINNYRLERNRSVNYNSTVSRAVKTAARFSALSFTDEQAVQVPDLYEEFEFNHSYKKDDRFNYNGVLYKVNQDHTSQEQWVPGETGTESLYTKIVLNQSGYNVWQQPTGAHDAYNTGDIVEYKGTLYKSLIDGNVWAPDTYPQGWQEYDASTSTEPSTPDPGTETPTEPSEPDYPDFVQPTGAHDAYKKGDIVRYNGKLYQSLIDANAYSPDAYPQGWQEYSEE